MPSKGMPTFTRAEVESHNSAKSCYVTIGRNVYDMTDFVDAHPGGSDLILEYAGKDVSEILKDEDSHYHSESAYDMLDESLIGHIAGEKSEVDPLLPEADTFIPDKNGRLVHPRTGMAHEEDLSKETDYEKDYKTHQFLDLNRPLFPQVWFGGFTKEFYLDQVHRPRHYKGGESAPLFGNFLEPLTKTVWWFVPLFWFPPVFYGTYIASKGFDNHFVQAAYWVLGIFFWTIAEYGLHRFLFHLDYYLPDNRVGITLHFTLHGIHHYLPMDKYRLVLPPALFIVLVTPFWKLAHFVFFWDWNVATTVFCGGIFMYVIYDMTHYWLHHNNLPFWYKDLKKYHLQHHFLDYENGFGITSRFWDWIFGTLLKDPIVKNK